MFIERRAAIQTKGNGREWTPGPQSSIRITLLSGLEIGSIRMLRGARLYEQQRVQEGHLQEAGQRLLPRGVGHQPHQGDEEGRPDQPHAHKPGRHREHACAANAKGVGTKRGISLEHDFSLEVTRRPALRLMLPTYGGSWEGGEGGNCSHLRRPTRGWPGRPRTARGHHHQHHTCPGRRPPRCPPERGPIRRSARGACSLRGQRRRNR